MLHLLNHALAKSMSFLLAGRILHRYRSTDIARVSGLLQTHAGDRLRSSRPACLALIGLPPFGLFVSEFLLLRAGFAAGRSWLMGIVLVLLRSPASGSSLAAT